MKKALWKLLLVQGTPRIANRLLKRSRDFAQVKYDGIISKEAAVDALERMK